MGSDGQPADEHLLRLGGKLRGHVDFIFSIELLALAEQRGDAGPFQKGADADGQGKYVGFKI